jgi:amidase
VTEIWTLPLCPVSEELPFADRRDVASAADFAALLAAQLPMIAFPFRGPPGMAGTTGRVAGPLGPAPVRGLTAADHVREDLLLEPGR